MSLTLPETTDVFICGGGPSGMAAALSIAHHSPGTSITIVDMMPDLHKESRAFVLHARTLEALKTIGVAETLERAGCPAPATKICNQKGTLLVAESWRLHTLTSFPFVLVISQWKTEGILAKFVEDRGIKVLRPLKVSGIAEVEDSQAFGYKFVVTMESGQTVKAKYIIGADGSRSAIRSAASIAFTEVPPASPSMRRIHKPPQALLLADVIFSSDTPKEVLAEINNGLRYTLGELGLFLIVPIFDDIDEANFERKDIVPSYHRLAFFLTDDEMPHRSEMVTIPKLQARLERSYFISSSGTRIAPEIVKVTWGNTYRVRFCIAEQIVKTYSNGGNVILVGDAAHIHSPASGQGMNVGICDGLDAGKAIAEHIRTGDSSVLVKLDEQLKKVAMGTLLMTRMFGWVGFIHGRWGRFFRDWIMWTVGRFAPLRKKMAFRISGLAYWVK